MKAKDVKVGHVYYVNYNPVREKEFGKEHLAIVLKKNENKVTFVTLPLTSDSKGLGKNKIEIDLKNSLPSNLRGKNSYAVYDQIRTVNASRFRNLMEKGKPFESVVPESEMIIIFEAVIKNLLTDMQKENRKKILDSCI